MAHAQKSGRSRRSRLTCQVIILFTVLCCIVSGIPSGSGFLTEHGDHVVIAAEQTALWLGAGLPVNPGSITVTPDLLEYAKSKGVSEDKLKIFIAAAYDQNIRPWHIMGFLQIESHFCDNIGAGVAIDEVTKRYQTAPWTTKAWWLGNITALNLLAKQLGVDIRSIPGSLGAGAISCMQIMPINWMIYGGGDYNDVFTSVVNAGKYLNNHGYKKSFKAAVRAYNRNAGDPYVNAVVNAAAKWELHFTGVAPDQELELVQGGNASPAMTILVFLEFLGKAMNGEQFDPIDGLPGTTPDAGKFVHPFPGFTGYGYRFMSPVYVGGVKVADHTGDDYIGTSGKPILAAHNGVVTYAQYLSRFNWLAAKWWISGNVVIIKGQLEDGRSVCTFYGHGQDNSFRVRKNDTVAAGQTIMANGNTGYSSTAHLHFAIKVGGKGYDCSGGKWVNPDNWVSR